MDLFPSGPVRKQFISLIPYFATGHARKRTSEERPFRGCPVYGATSRSDRSPLPSSLRDRNRRRGHHNYAFVAEMKIIVLAVRDNCAPN
ncbi:hypothetical protein CEXT_227311 [Caerostris extrusa]|uniref:Ycf15 n=1 Tax=Caerostris extrusa TaxID=172846 RepID=A0AAV4XL42_CAEEX|nr:hypothetical protein CEXT_227311 [Caerostris extrusa]